MLNELRFRGADAVVPLPILDAGLRELKALLYNFDISQTSCQVA